MAKVLSPDAEPRFYFRDYRRTRRASGEDVSDAQRIVVVVVVVVNAIYRLMVALNFLLWSTTRSTESRHRVCPHCGKRPLACTTDGCGVMSLKYCLCTFVSSCIFDVPNLHLVQCILLHGTLLVQVASCVFTGGARSYAWTSERNIEVGLKIKPASLKAFLEFSKAFASTCWIKSYVSLSWI